MTELSTDEGKGYLVLGIVRIVLGFMFVWAFFDKLLGLGMLTTPENAIINGGSPTEYYLTQLVSGPFEGMWHAIAGNSIVDLLLMFGLIAVGVCMMVGVASKLSTAGSVVMMILMYMLCIPPQDKPWWTITSCTPSHPWRCSGSADSPIWDWKTVGGNCPW